MSFIWPWEPGKAVSQKLELLGVDIKYVVPLLFARVTQGIYRKSRDASLSGDHLILQRFQMKFIKMLSRRILQAQRTKH